MIYRVQTKDRNEKTDRVNTLTLEACTGGDEIFLTRLMDGLVADDVDRITINFKNGTAIYSDIKGTF